MDPPEKPIPRDEVPSVSAVPPSQWALHDDYQVQPSAPPAPPTSSSTYQETAFFPAPGVPSTDPSQPSSYFPAPDSTSAPLPVSSGPQLTQAKFGGWQVTVLALNIAVIALLVLCGLNVNGARNTFGAAAGVTYLVYLFTALCSPSAKSLRHIMTIQDSLAFVDTLRQTRAIVTASIVCYHYETRTRHVRTKDKNGHVHHRTESACLAL